MKIKKSLNSPSTDEEYADLGKALTRAIVSDNIKVADNWLRFITVNFVRGLFVGLGSIIGATILVAVVIWLLNAFDSLPVIGEWFERLQGSIQSGADQLP